MKKIDLGQTVSILANIGVIAGIVFLGVEIRQNTRSQEASSYQVLMAGIARFNEVEISDPEVLQLLEGIRGATLAEMEPDDRTRVEAYMFIQLRFGDMAFHQFELGLISEARLESALAPLKAYSCLAIFQEHWSNRKSAFVEPFQDLLDQKIAEC